MDISVLLEKKKKYEAVKDSIPEATLASYESAFEVEYTHNSTAIEGNTLTLMETKVVLEDGIAIGGKSLREIYEVVNHKNAYRYVKKCIGKGFVLEEIIVKDIHALLMQNIFTGGIYRRDEVLISGASHTPPAGNEMYAQIKNFYVELSQHKELNDIQLAAWTHAEFVRIHPFLDGNGRTSRLLMNYQLMGKGYIPISIAKEDRLEYYNALDKYALHGDINDFADMIAVLEEKQLDRYLAQAVIYEQKPPTQTM